VSAEKRAIAASPCLVAVSPSTLKRLFWATMLFS
jgi:hypothetical protein